MARFDLTDFEWSVIQPLLPTKVRGISCSSAPPDLLHERVKRRQVISLRGKMI
jgi:transposase